MYNKTHGYWLSSRLMSLALAAAAEQIVATSCVCSPFFSQARRATCSSAAKPLATAGSLSLAALAAKTWLCFSCRHGPEESLRQLTGFLRQHQVFLLALRGSCGVERH